MLVIPGPEQTRAQERAEERRQIDTLTATLRDLRALLGAEETVFFRYTRMRETIEAAAWSTEGADRPNFRVELHGTHGIGVRPRRYSLSKYERTWRRNSSSKSSTK